MGKERIDKKKEEVRDWFEVRFKVWYVVDDFGMVYGPWSMN